MCVEKSINDKVEKIAKKYKDGRRCPVCNQVKPIDEFRFTNNTIYRSQCNYCNMLITTICKYNKASKSDAEFIKNKKSRLFYQLNILEIIEKYQGLTDVNLAKIYNSTILKNKE